VAEDGSERTDQGHPCRSKINPPANLDTESRARADPQTARPKGLRALALDSRIRRGHFYLLSGQYGPTANGARWGEEEPQPKRASLPKGPQPEDLSPEAALGLLRCPRLLGANTPMAGKRCRQELGPLPCPYIVHDKGKGEKDTARLRPKTTCSWWPPARAIGAGSPFPEGSRPARQPALKDLSAARAAKARVDRCSNGPYGCNVEAGQGERVRCRRQHGRRRSPIEESGALVGGQGRHQAKQGQARKGLPPPKSR